MKINQIENDKIEIILSKEDLEFNKISFHALMSNSTQSQKLFLSMLEFAEKEIGFKTHNYDVAIETIALNNSDFILTITRLKKYNEFEIKKFKIGRKKYDHSNTYKFKNFNDFFLLIRIVHPCKISFVAEHHYRYVYVFGACYELKKLMKRYVRTVKMRYLRRKNIFSIIYIITIFRNCSIHSRNKCFYRFKCF